MTAEEVQFRIKEMNVTLGQGCDEIIAAYEEGDIDEIKEAAIGVLVSCKLLAVMSRTEELLRDNASH